MLQQVMTAPGKIEFREIPPPEPRPGEALKKIMKTGVCGSTSTYTMGSTPSQATLSPRATRFPALWKSWGRA